MTEKELETAIAAHEMHRLELKESFGAECIETACAFANAQGGRIMLGVDDRGNLVRLPLRFEALRDYENRIATATEPSVAVDAEKVAFRGGEVVVLKVPENPLKPVAVKGRSFVRKGSVNHQMTPAEIAEAHLKSTGAGMDAVFVPGATRADLDMALVRDYMAKAVAAGRRSFLADEDPWLVLRKLQFVRSETEITRAACLLFAREPQLLFSQAIVHAGAFRDEGALILDSVDVDGNIQNQIERTIDFIKRNIRRSIVVTGKAEHDRVWEYPVEALRETVTNAICHRDYASPHDIQIKILEDRLVVISPGLLPFDMDLETLENPEHGSRPRNKLIAQAFYDMHLIEHYGSGIGRIKDECAKNGNKAPTWSQKYGSFITVYESRLNEDELANEPQSLENGRTTPHPAAGSEGKNEVVSEADNKPDNNRTINRTLDNIIVDEVRRSPGINRAEVAKAVGKGKSVVAEAVARLKAIGVIEYRGSKKTGGYYAVKEGG